MRGTGKLNQKQTKMSDLKPYLRAIVRNGGKGRMGLGVEMFRLDTADEEELTAEELEEAAEVKE